MNDMKVTRLCRICLQDGALYPIFEKSESKDILYEKLLLCLQCNKIEDVEGFPRHICTLCNDTITTITNFINKYKESSKILENGLKFVKKEVDYVDRNDTVTAGVIIDMKVESDDHFNDIIDDIEDEKPLIIIKKIKKKPIKRVTRSRKKIKTHSGIVLTNKVASSILEGNFLWTGEKWCIKTEQTKLKKYVLPKPRPQTTVKFPNHNIKPEKKLCDLCGDIFNSQDKLNSHKKKVHFRNPVKCPKCPKVCLSNYYLKSHIKRKHGPRDFICSTCGLGFAYKGELSTHIKNVHDKGLKPKKSYSCKFCEKTYKCQKSVTVHERSVHTGERPAECSVCGSCFYHEDYLKEHMRLHTGETPFKCPICGRGYAQRGNMKSHLKIHRISELDAVTISKLRPNYLKLLKE